MGNPKRNWTAVCQVITAAPPRLPPAPPLLAAKQIFITSPKMKSYVSLKGPTNMQTRIRTTFIISSCGQIAGEVFQANQKLSACESLLLTLISPFENILEQIPPPAAFQQAASFSSHWRSFPQRPVTGRPDKNFEDKFNLPLLETSEFTISRRFFLFLWS